MSQWKWVQIEPGVLGLQGAPVQVRAVSMLDGGLGYQVWVSGERIVGVPWRVLGAAKADAEHIARDMREIGSI